MTVPNTTPAGMPLDETALAERIARLIARNGNDPSRAMGVLLDENSKYRERRRKDKELIERLQKGAPAEGAVVLTPEQAKVWAKLQELKFTDKPEDLAKELTDLRAFKADQESRTLWSEAAGVAKYDKDVLADLMIARGLKVEMREVSVKKDNKTVKERVPFVVKASGEAEELVTYAERDLKRYLPSLRMTEQDGGDGEGDHTPGGQPDGMVHFPAHSESRGGKERPKTNVASSVLGGLYTSPFAKTSDKKE